MGNIRFYNNKVLFVSNKVAMHENCCCCPCNTDQPASVVANGTCGSLENGTYVYVDCFRSADSHTCQVRWWKSDVGGNHRYLRVIYYYLTGIWEAWILGVGSPPPGLYRNLNADLACVDLTITGAIAVQGYDTCDPIDTADVTFG